MTRQAIALARVLQALGYFGPCSLDAVLRVNSVGGRDLHWIECNGRWSGVSIPLAAAAKRQGRGRIGGFVVLQEMLKNPRVRGLAGLVDTLTGLLLRPGATEGIALLSPPTREAGLLVNAYAVGETQVQAQDLVRAAMARIS